MFFKQSVSLAMLLVLGLGCRADHILTPYPDSATEGAIKYQPYLQIDWQGCYQSVAIGVDGQLNDGIDPRGPDIPHGGTKRATTGKVNLRAESDDRAGGDLIPPRPPPDHAGWQSALVACRNHKQNSQTYVRQRCNNGWCAYLYGYYFEADLNPWEGHRHDWEHIIVWTLNDRIFYVTWSAHGGWTTDRDVDVLFKDDTYPLFVYERGPHGYNNHRIRNAVVEDDTETADWYRAPLLSLEMARCDRVSDMLQHDWESAHPELHKDRFSKALNNSMPEGARLNEHFDAFLSDYDHA